jgi:hypothetical protein
MKMPGLQGCNDPAGQTILGADEGLVLAPNRVLARDSCHPHLVLFTYLNVREEALWAGTTGLFPVALTAHGHGI